jgi:hypothetical protein
VSPMLRRRMLLVLSGWSRRRVVLHMLRDRAYHVVDGHQAWASDRKACRRSDSSSMETWQRLPQYQDNIGRRKANDRYGSSYEVLNSLEDDSCSAEGELDVLDFKVRIHSSSAAVEG